MRSYLFVPGDSPRKFAKARAGAADALILDLEDSVAHEAKIAARRMTCAMLQEDRSRQKLFVRVNAFETGLTLDDLVAVMPLRPDGIVLPKCAGAADILRLSHYLDALECAAHTASGETRIVAIATETADAVLSLGGYKDAGPRLTGLMWGAEDLAADIGAAANTVEGRHTEPFRLARNLCLMAAARAGIAAIDTICPAVDDPARVRAEARDACRDGFSAKAVIHPGHVDIVNAAFTPSPEEIAWAEKVIAAFAASPQSGVVNLDGRMIDRPHERMARRILGRASAD